MTLQALGYDAWFRNQWGNPEPDDLQPARIITVHRNSCVIQGDRGMVPADMTGKMVFDAESGLDLPATGDWVRVQYLGQDTGAVIHSIIPRKNVLKRKTAGKTLQHQIIAANIDTAFIVQSLNFDYNPRRLERYLTMITASDITPVILLSKSDAVSEEQRDRCVTEFRDLDNRYDVIAFSNKTGDGLDRIRDIIVPGKTYCLLGSSGVGKTSLINSLTGTDALFTMPVREKDGKGRHATTRRQLCTLGDGGLIIDTPGMRELGNIGVEQGISETFTDIETLADECRFTDCTHGNEPGCAVIAAVDNGTIPAIRYNSYLKLKKESDHYNRTRLEKQRKDKKSGKFIKSVVKKSRKK